MIHLIIIQNFRDAKKLSMPRNTTQLNLSQHMFCLAEREQLCPVLQLLILNICLQCFYLISNVETPSLERSYVTHGKA